MIENLIRVLSRHFNPILICLTWAVTFALSGRSAQAVPGLSAQTGLPCEACHVGTFGPQLTPFGRAYKIDGYTLGGGGGIASNVPLSMMVAGSFTRTSADLPADMVPHHYAANNNFSLDEITGWLAGRVTEHTGGLIQLTFDDIGNASHVDMVDLRPYTTTVSLGGHELRVGTTLNNAPTVQDPYNALPQAIYPYFASGIAPMPAPQPMLARGFINNAIGYTAYAWYDRHLYLEAGAYNTFSPWLLARFGDDIGVGSTTAPAPYLRAAYEWDWNRQVIHLGALFMHADVHPPSGVPFQTDGSMGSDHYTDYAVDSGYQYLGDATHIVTWHGVLIHEDENLRGSAGLFNAANGTSFGSRYGLNQIRTNVSYWYKNTYGFVFGWQGSWGSANPVLYQPGELTGSNYSKPTSSAFTIEADWVPFGHSDSPLPVWASLMLGLQYVSYTQFNGAAVNYDGTGRRAGDNNTIFAYALLGF